MEVLRELPEQGAKLPAPRQRFEWLIEAPDPSVEHRQPLDVGDVAAHLHREAEPFGTLIDPALDGGAGGEAVEGVVDLDRVEVLGVEAEPGALRDALRIEELAPVGVDPARAADVDLHYWLPLRWRTSTAMSSRGSPPWRLIAAWARLSAISSALWPANPASSLMSQSGSSDLLRSPTSRTPSV